ncbi:MAG: S-methyl-5'-thioadenosine phosphorylase [Acidobacteria bacterium]|nr:S-methyl-5'-thioadenosine phosphorylase [Acidobacteriota bacterium]
MAEADIGIIGGTGLYQPDEIEAVREVRIDTPFGAPSDVFHVGTWRGRKVAFLARHGRGHVLSPTEINYRANIYAFKVLGVARIISASAVGSLRDDIHPMDVVIPDQFFDRTRQRPQTFFGDGLVAHVSLADPTCAVVRAALTSACREAGARFHDRGTYLCIEGPQFSTRAESQAYRAMKASVIGMTNLPEARLAREAEICYGTLALVTDYDCWHVAEQAVTVDAVLGYLKRNAETARAVMSRAVETLPVGRDCPCATALASAVITERSAIAPVVREKLRPIVGRYLA